MNERYSVLMTCGAFEPGRRYGGPARSAGRIVETTPRDIDLTVVVKDRDLAASKPYPGLSGQWVTRPQARLFYLDHRNPVQCWRLWRELRSTRFNLLYANSIWARDTIAAVVAARLRLLRADAVLVAPRGELSPGALAIRSRKKRLFMRFWAPLLRSMGVVWHASTECEAREIRAICPWASVEINDNMVALAPEPIAPVAHDGPARLVFISRICAKKNLDLVLSALTGVTVEMQLDIYGPIEDPAYWARCRALMDQMPAGIRTTYRGELAPADVTATFAHYDAFLFPTSGENFGHVIAESLSASCPVVCSDRTPWTAILTNGGGMVLAELSATCLREAIEKVAAMTSAEKLDTRQAAGDAFRVWQPTVTEVNVLEQFRRARTARTRT